MPPESTAPSADVAVIGAGVVGASCAWHAVQAGLRVTVLDRGSVAGGTTGAGEGNILVSDKRPGPELDLTRLSIRLWQRIAAEVGGFEYEPKGGVVVAASEAGLAELLDTSREQSAAGVETVRIPPDGLVDYEPRLAPDLVGGAYYPEDAQVQPMLAAAQLLAAARSRGAQVRLGVEATGFLRDGDRVVGVLTDVGRVPAGAVINAAGTWGGGVAALAGLELPVLPRRGFILVTEPLPRVVRHKVYAAEYLSDVASSDAALHTSPVVEGTRAGPVLIGSSRERVGFDRTMSVPVLRRLAEQAIRLFPILADVAVIRAYRGFRPYSPDHLPIIGPDRQAPGLYHACGHEGAGVGLAAATGHVLARLLAGERPEVDVDAFRPERFE